MDKENICFDRFLALSALLTGFERVELLGSGVAQEYYRQVNDIIGTEIFQQLLFTSATIIECYGNDEEALETAIRREILANIKLGAVAKNIIQLWYLGSWVQMPQSWRTQYGNNPSDVTTVVSSQAYQEGLVWSVIKAHPPGAKQPGFGSWAHLPINKHM